MFDQSDLQIIGAAIVRANPAAGKSDFPWNQSKTNTSLVSENIYVEIINGTKKGSIARVGIIFDPPNYDKHRKLWHRYYYQTISMKLHIDGKRAFTEKERNLKLLPDYAGPTVFKNSDSSELVFPDMLGQTVKIGSVVALPNNTRQLVVGTVTKFTNDCFYMQPIIYGGKNARKFKPKLCRKYSSGTLIINDDLRDNLLLLKLKQ